MFLGVTAYYSMSDTSVRGLTVKVFNVSRFCTPDPGITDPVVAYDISSSVWSTHSLRTSLTNLKFILSVDDVRVGTVNETDRSLDPGQGASFSLSFKDFNLSPDSLASSSRIVLTVTAQVSAGVSSSTLTRSDSFQQDFGSTAC